MQWKKNRITLNVWQEGVYTITEDTREPPELRFRLDSGDDLDAAPEFFPTIKQAQHAAELRNELALVREENARLRAELDNHRQAEAYERVQRGMEQHRKASPEVEDDDGRGVPEIATVAHEDSCCASPRLAFVSAGEGDFPF